MPFRKVDHDFAHKELSYDEKPNYQPYIKVSFFFKKVPGISDEQFHRHWETVHADLTIATKAFRVGSVRRYAQIHITNEAKEAAKSLQGLDQLDFDGCTEMLVQNWDDYLKFLGSEEFTTTLAEDSTTFIQKPVKILIGYENLIYGQAIPGVNAKDGVLF